MRLNRKQRKIQNKRAEISVRRKRVTGTKRSQVERRRWWCRSENNTSLEIVYENEWSELSKLDRTLIKLETNSTTVELNNMLRMRKSTGESR